MKQFFMRSGLALACLAGLASCGGSDGDIAIGVSISGVNRPGITLKLNDFAPQPVGASGFYVFPDRIPYDSDYRVTFTGKPDNVAEDCVLANGTGSVSTISPTNITLTCKILTYHLGGTIKGLAKDETGLVLINGSVQKVIPANPTDGDLAFTMTSTVDGKDVGKVPQRSPYGVLVLTSPTNKTCTVAGGTGEMPGADVTSVVVTCVSNN
jgi:hypothetical protein